MVKNQLIKTNKVFTNKKEEDHSKILRHIL